MTVLDGLFIEDLLWNNGIDYAHFRQGSRTWIEFQILDARFKIHDTYPSEDGSWTVQSDSLDISQYSDEGFYLIDTPETLTEVSLIEYLMELPA